MFKLYTKIKPLKNEVRPFFQQDVQRPPTTPVRYHSFRTWGRLKGRTFLCLYGNIGWKVFLECCFLLIRLYMARGTGWLLGMLPGPSRAVNCAGWKPWNLHMLVLFASEGRTVPVRGSICVSLKQKETHDNRVVCHSNGWSSSVSKDDMPIILVRMK